MTSARRMKVAIIEPVGGYGGMHYYDAGLCRGLASHGADVALYTSSETLDVSGGLYAVHGVFHGVFGAHAACFRGIRYLSALISTMVQATREGRWVCHFHFFGVGLVQLFTVILARMLRRRVVITVHDVESFVAASEKNWMSRTAYSLAHKLIVHNRTSRDELLQQLGNKCNQVSVVPMGNHIHSQLQDLDPVEARKRLALDPAARVLLFFGQIKEVKGLDVLLDAMPGIVSAYPSARLVIAGRPWRTDFTRYQRQIEQLGIQSCCLPFPRFIRDDEVATFIAAADLVILPYRRIYQSDVILLAMSRGKAVLVSDIPGMLEIINDQVNGFVFKSGDSGHLAEVVRQCLGDPDRIRVVGKSGLDYVREHNDWDVIGKMTMELYLTVGRDQELIG